jgi:hypothetical protein
MDTHPPYMGPEVSRPSTTLAYLLDRCLTDPKEGRENALGDMQSITALGKSLAGGIQLQFCIPH